MSEWTHILTIAVPDLLISQANQLALAIGTSEDDVNTFRVADWTDGTGNFAVCSTRAVDKTFDYVASVDVTDNTLLTEWLTALSFVAVTTDEDGVQAITGNDPTKIRVVVDAGIKSRGDGMKLLEAIINRLFILAYGMNQLLSGILFLKPDHTVSGEVGYAATLNKLWALRAERVLDTVFGEKHCYNAIEWDRAGKPSVKIWK